jgi:hypothetical protein
MGTPICGMMPLLLVGPVLGAVLTLAMQQWIG